MKVCVIRSAVIDAPIDRVWAVLRDFNSHERWHPAVASSRMENDLDGDVVGGVRRFSLADGAELREQLLRHSDREHAFSYCILDSPLPLFDFVATVRLKPVTDGNQTFWDWRSQFRVPEHRAAELENLIGQQVYEAGFAGMRRFLAEKEGLPRPAGPEAAAAAFPAAVGEYLPSKAMVVTSTGGPEAMTLRDVTVPAPGPRQVRIRQSAIAVNYLDLQHRRGVTAGFELPGTPGVEGVGEIIDVGEHVNGLFPGDRIAYLSRKPGAYAEIRCIDADACIPLPDSVSDIDASALLKGLTAALLLSRVFRAAPGATILIEAVSGGLGHLLSQWAKSMGLTVLGTVSTAEKAKFSRDRGCDYPLVAAAGTSLAAEVMRITNGRGVDYWVHSGGAGGLDAALACLSRCGHCAVIGDRDGQSIPLDVNVLKQRSLTVSAPVCFDYFDDRPYLHRLAHQLFAKIQSRTIAPAVEALPLSQASEAHSRIEARQTMGAVVLTSGG
ncbi:MAG: Alcohol dehydrogenase zinc-binding domain protein [Deltaproteobacteria bacterium]|nr:Alcohol dehydrogenase zinc-binding domain protein [Deltaproteobacteria bacterium]